MSVVIYGDINCAWCEKAKATCEQYQLPYEYKTIRTPGILEELQELVPGVRSVPQIFWNGHHFANYNDFHQEIENTRNYGQERF